MVYKHVVRPPVYYVTSNERPFGVNCQVFDVDSLGGAAARAYIDCTAELGSTVTVTLSPQCDYWRAT